MISSSPDLQKPVLGLISCTCDVPMLVILLVALLVGGLVVFLLVVVRQCKRTRADCSWARALADMDDLTGLGTGMP